MAQRGSRCARDAVSRRCRPSAAPTSSAVASALPACGTGENPGLPGKKKSVLPGKMLRGGGGGGNRAGRRSSRCWWRSRAGDSPQQHAVPSAASSAAAMGRAPPAGTGAAAANGRARTGARDAVSLVTERGPAPLTPWPMGKGKRTPSPWQRIEAPPAGNGRPRDSSRQRLGETLGGHAPPKRLRPPALSSVTVLNGAPGWRGGRVDVVQHNT